MIPQLVVKAVFFTILLPGVVTIVVPFLILGRSVIEIWPDLSVLGVFAALAGVIAGVSVLHCIWGFAFYGKGTLAPIQPPVILVVRGLYRYTRNPMYISVLFVLLAETLFFHSPVLLIYTAIILLGFHLFVRLYEEPHLKTRFGEQYLDYCRVVPRWGITLRPLSSTGTAT